MKGATSHKMIDLGANPVLRHYYHNRVSTKYIQYMYTVRKCKKKIVRALERG